MLSKANSLLWDQKVVRCLKKGPTALSNHLFTIIREGMKLPEVNLYGITFLLM